MERREVRVVVADNNLQERESKVAAMKEMGMKVILSTGDGRKALETIKQELPDVVVMDMILPGIDGIGILEEVNNAPLPCRPIFLIVTALKVEMVMEQMLQMGADYFMMKPVSNQMLIHRISQLVENRIKTPKLQMQSNQKLYSLQNDEEEELQKVAKSGYQYSGDLEMDVTNILLEIGIPAHIKGYQYIREGILMAFYDRNMLHYITKFLYPSIAKKYMTTSGSVERTIRHAIEVAWRRGDMETLERVFGNTICASKGKPTNSEFMALLTDKLRLEYRHKQVS